MDVYGNPYDKELARRGPCSPQQDRKTASAEHKQRSDRSIERGLEIGGPEPDQALIKVRNTRDELRERGIWLTDEILQRAKDEGRP